MRFSSLLLLLLLYSALLLLCLTPPTSATRARRGAEDDRSKTAALKGDGNPPSSDDVNDDDDDLPKTNYEEAFAQLPYDWAVDDLETARDQKVTLKKKMDDAKQAWENKKADAKQAADDYKVYAYTWKHLGFEVEGTKGDWPTRKLTADVAKQEFEAATAAVPKAVEAIKAAQKAATKTQLDADIKKNKEFFYELQEVPEKLANFPKKKKAVEDNILEYKTKLIGYEAANGKYETANKKWKNADHDLTLSNCDQLTTTHCQDIKSKIGGLMAERDKLEKELNKLYGEPLELLRDAIAAVDYLVKENEKYTKLNENLAEHTKNATKIREALLDTTEEMNRRKQAVKNAEIEKTTAEGVVKEKQTALEAALDAIKDGEPIEYKQNKEKQKDAETVMKEGKIVKDTLEAEVAPLKHKFDAAKRAYDDLNRQIVPLERRIPLAKLEMEALYGPSPAKLGTLYAIILWLFIVPIVAALWAHRMHKWPFGEGTLNERFRQKKWIKFGPGKNRKKHIKYPFPRELKRYMDVDYDTATYKLFSPLETNRYGPNLGPTPGPPLLLPSMAAALAIRRKKPPLNERPKGRKKKTTTTKKHTKGNGLKKRTKNLKKKFGAKNFATNGPKIPDAVKLKEDKTQQDQLEAVPVFEFKDEDKTQATGTTIQSIAKAPVPVPVPAPAPALKPTESPKVREDATQGETGVGEPADEEKHNSAKSEPTQATGTGTFRI